MRPREFHRHDTQIFGEPGSVVPRSMSYDPRDAARLSRTRDGETRFRVVTGTEITHARLVVKADDVFSVEMELEMGGTGRRVWQVVEPIPDRSQYSFAFLAGAETAVYLTPAGIANAVERLDRWTLDLAAVAVVDVPDWARGAVIYQAFPDRFANGDPSNDPTDAAPWGSEPERHQFQGGDLQGIIDNLDHLERLGVDVLYLNPVVTSPSNHRYDASDFHNVDPLLGGNEAMDALRAELSARGIRLLVDLSINHCHPTHESFADVRQKGQSSVYWPWFRVESWPLELRVRPEQIPDDEGHFGTEDIVKFEAATGIPVIQVAGAGPWIEPTYDAWYGVPTMPRFDLGNPDCRSYLTDVAAHWLQRFDADGIRMDVARYIELDVWREVRRALRAVKADAYLVCEIIGSASPWLQGDTFDGTMNYVFRDVLLGFVADASIDGHGFLDAYERMVAMYTPEGLAVSQSLLGSHDTPRFLTEAGGERWRLELATFLQMTLPGAPGIYYGDEVYLEGSGDPGCRKAFPWGEEATAPLVDTIAELVDLRREHAALRTGSWSPVAATEDVVAFVRSSGAETLTVVANRADQPARLRVEPGRLLFGKGRSDAGVLEVPPRSGLIVEGGRPL